MDINQRNLICQSSGKKSGLIPALAYKKMLFKFKQYLILDQIRIQTFLLWVGKKYYLGEKEKNHEYMNNSKMNS